MSNNNFDFQDMIKSQMLTMGMLNTNDKDGEDNNNFMKIIYGLIVMQMVEAATKAVPVVISEIKRYINNKLEQKRRQYEEKLFAPDPVMKSSIIFDVNKVNCVENETKIKENEEKLKKQEEEMEQKIKEILEKQEEENKRLRKEFEEEKDILRTSLNKTTIKVLPPKGKRQRKRV